MFHPHEASPPQDRKRRQMVKAFRSPAVDEAGVYKADSRPGLIRQDGLQTARITAVKGGLHEIALAI